MPDVRARLEGRALQGGHGCTGKGGGGGGGVGKVPPGCDITWMGAQNPEAPLE